MRSRQHVNTGRLDTQFNIPNYFLFIPISGNAIVFSVLLYGLYIIKGFEVITAVIWRFLNKTELNQSVCMIMCFMCYFDCVCAE